MAFKNVLNDLNITTKIHGITILAVFAFVVAAIINYNTIIDNEQALNELKTKSYQSVKTSTINRFLIEKLDEFYGQAVTLGDEEYLNKANETLTEIQSNLKQLTQLDSSLRASNDQEKLTDYAKIAGQIAQSMIDGTADFSKIQQDAQTKQAKYDELIERFTAIQQKSDNRYLELINNTEERSHNSLVLMLTISTIMLVGLIILAIVIAKAIGNAASDAAGSLEKLASGKGNLSSQLAVRSNDEIGQVAIHFNAFISLLRESVMGVMAVVEPLMENSTRLVQGMEKAERATNQQSNDAKVVHQSMEEMRHSASDISSSAINASEAAQAAEREVEESLNQIKQSVTTSQTLSQEIDSAANTIDQLASDTQNVSQILNVITSIAEQTNLLALNAAIEAARAGEQGRGFAVVADEVRELASRTAKSTNEIRELLTALTSGANESVGAMTKARDMAKDNAEAAEQTGSSISLVSEQILSINTMNAQIATATEQQTNVATMVVDNVTSMHESFENTLAALADIREVAENLHKHSDSLLDATSKFDV
ncbi:methyl-accepting chemotaxis protein [Thalassotalea fusca]